jgi:hypothetical protein
VSQALVNTFEDDLVIAQGVFLLQEQLRESVG